jgi:hypothetical protein
MSQPVLVETFGTVGVVPQESVSETPKRMVPSFMRSGVHVDILQFLQRRVKMATNDVRRRNGSSRPSAEQKARFSVADELFEEGRNRGVNINLAKAIRCFESLFDPAVMNLLLDENGQKIARDVLVDLDAKRLPCDGFVIGEPVKLVSFNYDGNQRRGVTTTCRRSDGREYEVAASEVLVQSIRTVRDISASTAIGWAWCPMPSMKKLHDAPQSPESARDRSLWRIR